MKKIRSFNRLPLVFCVGAAFSGSAFADEPMNVSSAGHTYQPSLTGSTTPQTAGGQPSRPSFLPENTVDCETEPTNPACQIESNDADVGNNEASAQDSSQTTVPADSSTQPSTAPIQPAQSVNPNQNVPAQKAENTTNVTPLVDGTVKAEAVKPVVWHKAAYHQYADHFITLDSFINQPYLTPLMKGTDGTVTGQFQKDFKLGQMILRHGSDNLMLGATFTVANGKNINKFSRFGAFVKRNVMEYFIIGADIGYLKAQSRIEEKRVSQNVTQVGIVAGGNVNFGNAFVTSLAGVRYHHLPAVNSGNNVRAEKANLITLSSTNELGYHFNYAGATVTPSIGLQVIVPKNGQKVVVLDKTQESLLKTQYRLSAGVRLSFGNFYLNAKGGTQNKQGFGNLAFGYDF